MKDPTGLNVAWSSPTPTQTTYNASDVERDHVAYVEGKVKSAEDTRPKFLEDTFLNHAFVLGKQWYTWNQRALQLQPPNVDPWQVCIVKNYTLPIVQTAIGKLTQGDPSWIAVPRTDEETDAQRARACEALLDGLHQLMGMSTKVTEFVYWMLVAGIGVYRVQWGFDTNLNMEMPDVQPVSPLQWLCDPGCERRDLSDAQWAAEQCYVNVDMLRQQFPDKAEYIWPSASYGTDTLGLSLMESANNMLLGGTMMRNADRAKVIYYYERPSQARPEGIYAVVSCGMVLRQDVLPLGRLPYVVARHNAVGGRLYGDGMVNSMRGPQTLVNKYESVLVETVDLVSTPKWAVEKGSVGANSFTRQPGEIIEYEQGSRPPEPMASPPIPPVFAQLIASARDTLQEVSGISEISQGIATTNISGRAAQRLAELDATKFGPTTREIESAYNDLGVMVLELWRQYADEKVTLQLLGKNNRPEVLVFEKEQITGITVRLQPGSMRVRHPSVEQEKTLMMFERGALGNPQDPKVLERVQRDMAVGAGSLEAGTVRGETTYAREENFVLVHGGPDPRVLPTDDHAAHITEHRALLRTDDVRLGEPRIVDVILGHVAEHEAYMASEQGRPIPAWVNQYAPDLVMELQPPPPEAAPPAPAGEQMLRPTSMPFDDAGGVGLGEAPPVNMSAEMAPPPLLPSGPGVAPLM